MVQAARDLVPADLVPAQREKFVAFVLARRAAVEGFDATFNLRPAMLQVGAYPSDDTRTVRYRRVA